MDDQKAKVDADACVACGACEDECPEGAITMDDVAVVDVAKCTGCGSCVDACPEEAITLS